MLMDMCLLKFDIYQDAVAPNSLLILFIYILIYLFIHLFIYLFIYLFLTLFNVGTFKIAYC